MESCCIRLFLYYCVVMTACRLISAQAKFKLSLTFQYYINPNNGSMISPDCCDTGAISQTCYVPCETVFTICLREGDTSPTLTTCTLSMPQRSGVIASSEIQFTDAIGTLPNPLEYGLTTLPQSGVQAYIVVEDDDESAFDDDPLANMPDLIDMIFVNVPASSLGGSARSATYAGIHGIAMLDIEYMLYCAQADYYGPDCDMYCVPMSDPVNGYYTCDRLTGAKICNPGYTDPATNCVNAITSATIPVTAGAMTVIPSAATSVVNTSLQRKMHTTRSETTKSDSVTKSKIQSSYEDISSTRDYQLPHSSIPPTTTSTDYGVTGTSKGNFGILAGSVGSTALVLIVVLGISVTTIVTLIVVKRRKKAEGRKSPTLSTDPLTNPVYSGIDLASYEPLTPQTLNTKSAIYTSLENPAANPQQYSIPINSAGGRTIRTLPLNRSISQPYEKPEPKTMTFNGTQEYAMLYETPIDGAAAARLNVVIQPEKTKQATEYMEPIDTITPCGNILVKIEDSLPAVAETT